MNNQNRRFKYRIEKKYISARIMFAMKNVPGVDQFTLNKLLELLNTTGTFGWITARQLVNDMKLMIKYVPGTSIPTLLIFIDLIDVWLPLNPKDKDELEMILHQQPKLIDSSSIK